jgi:hypothetical protein
MDFRGLGLPPQSFNQFAHLLNLASGGAATCETRSGGICLLSGACDAYPELWQYSFRVVFSANENWVAVPLATFAQQSVVDGNAACKIYV